MSYASVLAENAAPADQQPKPDPNLLEGRDDHGSIGMNSLSISEGDSEENADEKHAHSNQADGAPAERGKERASEKPKKATKKVRRNQVDDQPKTQVAGLMTWINVITLTATAFAAFKYWNRPSWDRRVISGCAIGIGGLIASQGYLARVFQSSNK